jgi:hypothetical protein
MAKAQRSLQDFIFRGEAIKLYREFIRTARSAPKQSQGKLLEKNFNSHLPVAASFRRSIILPLISLQESLKLKFGENLKHIKKSQIELRRNFCYQMGERG